MCAIFFPNTSIVNSLRNIESSYAAFNAFKLFWEINWKQKKIIKFIEWINYSSCWGDYCSLHDIFIIKIDQLILSIYFMHLSFSKIFSMKFLSPNSSIVITYSIKFSYRNISFLWLCVLYNKLKLKEVYNQPIQKTNDSLLLQLMILLRIRCIKKTFDNILINFCAEISFLGFSGIEYFTTHTSKYWNKFENYEIILLLHERHPSWKKNTRMF